MTRPEIVDTFVTAVVNVMQQVLGEEARHVATRYARDVDPAPSITVSIELSGTMRGPVTWSFSPTLARNVAQAMLLGQAQEEHHADAVAELANIVLGNAIGVLTDAGYLIELHPPAIRPRHVSRQGPQALVVDISSGSGQMKLLFDLEEAA